MKKFAGICMVLAGMAGCAESPPPSQTGITEDAEVIAKDPFYQLQEAEARKHQDSAPPRP